MNLQSILLAPTSHIAGIMAWAASPACLFVCLVWFICLFCFAVCCCRFSCFVFGGEAWGESVETGFFYVAPAVLELNVDQAGLKFDIPLILA